MSDRNLARMLWFGVATVFALLFSVSCQLYSGQADGEAKHAACNQAKRWLAESDAASASEDVGGKRHAGERRQKEQRTRHEQRLVDAAAACAADLARPDDGTVAWVVFLRTLGPFIGVMAFFLGGLRYDAGHGAVGGTASPTFAIAPDRRGRPGFWTATNSGAGVAKILAIRVVSFPQAGVRWSGSAFETLRTPLIIERDGSGSFEASARGDDLLVAVRVEDGERQAICWARFVRVHPGGDYEQREEGRVRQG